MRSYRTYHVEGFPQRPIFCTHEATVETKKERVESIVYGSEASLKSTQPESTKVLPGTKLNPPQPALNSANPPRAQEQSLHQLISSPSSFSCPSVSKSTTLQVPQGSLSRKPTCTPKSSHQKTRHRLFEPSVVRQTRMHVNHSHRKARHPKERIVMSSYPW